jgi:[ribosomal protein S18]-alanine N-acetyltransferase
MAAEPVDLRRTSPVEVEPMRRRHIRAVVRIEQQAYPRPWTSGLFLSELAQGDVRTYLAASVDGQVVGYGGVMYVLPDAHVTTVAVDVAHRRRGVATRLLLDLCRSAIAKGATGLTLEVRTSNDAAQALYRRFGFAPAGARRAYYPADQNGPAEDALVMWVHDLDHPDFAARLDAIEATLPNEEST